MRRATDRMFDRVTQVSQLDILPQLGATVTGKVATGTLRKNDKLTAKNLDNTVAGVEEWSHRAFALSLCATGSADCETELKGARAAHERNPCPRGTSSETIICLPPRATP